MRVELRRRHKGQDGGTKLMSAEHRREVGFEFDQRMQMSVWSVGPYDASRVAGCEQRENIKRESWSMQRSSRDNVVTRHKAQGTSSEGDEGHEVESPGWSGKYTTGQVSRSQAKE